MLCVELSALTRGTACELRSADLVSARGTCRRQWSRSVGGADRSRSV